MAAAIALRQAGIEATVYERAPELREVGAGLSLWPNAVHVLDHLGVGAALRAIGGPQLGGGIRAPDGRVLVGSSDTALAARFGAPTVLVHRAELLDALGQRLGWQHIQTGAELREFVQDVHGVTATFTNGQTARADLLIGADGLYSTVRQALFGHRPPRYSGYTAWRGVTEVPSDAELMKLLGEMWGRGVRLGMVPMSRGRVYWYAVRNAPEGEADGPAGRKADVLALVRGWARPAEEVIGATRDSAILRNDIYDRPPLRRWVVGRAALLGDAAHPMTPNLGQGACQALEDALELARCLRSSGDAQIGLDAYQARRLPRTSAIVRRSRQIGRVSQWSNPLACRLREALLRITPPAAQLRQLDWIVGYQV